MKTQIIEAKEVKTEMWIAWSFLQVYQNDGDEWGVC